LIGVILSMKRKLLVLASPIIFLLVLWLVSHESEVGFVGVIPIWATACIIALSVLTVVTIIFSNRCFRKLMKKYPRQEFGMTNIMKTKQFLIEKTDGMAVREIELLLETSKYHKCLFGGIVIGVVIMIFTI